MSNRTKIIIGILILIIVVTCICVIINNKQKEYQEKNNNNQFDIMEQYIDEIDGKTENEVNNEKTNEIDNEVKKNNINEKSENIVGNNKNSTVVGKEEEESSNENTQVNAKQKAIDLAKKEWGISVESYDFQASEVKSDGTYDVSVINKTNRNVITIYNVNIQNSNVKDITE